MLKSGKLASPMVIMPRRIARTLALSLALGVGYALALYLIIAQIFGIYSDHTERSQMMRAGDFPIMYAAGKIALSGNSLDVYNHDVMIAREKELTGRQVYFHFSYPPTALLFFTPFALFTPTVAFVAWIVVWSAILTVICHRLLPRRSTIVLATLYSGAVYSANCGQNGSLSAGLLLIAFSSFYRQPIVAGVALGLLTYKPHLALLPIGVAILFRRFTVVVSAAVTLGVVLIGSAVLFGLDTWTAFVRETFSQSGDLESGLLHAHQVAPFALIRKITDSLPVCYGVSVLIAALALMAVYGVWRRTDDKLLRNLSLVGAIPITTPYANDYDLAILVLPFIIACQHMTDEKTAPKTGIMVLAVVLALLPISASASQSFLPYSPASIMLVGLVTAARLAVRGMAPRQVFSQEAASKAIAHR
jgi:hypothetical protein